MKYLKMVFDLYRAKKRMTMSKRQMEQFRNKKLREILCYAYKASDYYHREFEKYGIADENICSLPLSSFPTIDKKSFLENFDSIVTAKDLKQDELRSFDRESTLCDKLYKNKYHIVHSSGSTGKPSYFVYDENAWSSMLIGIIRAALWNMSMPKILKFLAKKPHILYVAATNGRYGGAMAVGDGIDAVGVKQMFLDINEPLDEWNKKVDDFKPNMIIGYPSAIKILCELSKKEKMNIKVQRVVSCGEPLSKALRNYIEKTLNTEVLNFYGATESLALGIEENPNDGMLLFDDMNYIESINGHTYITSLYNFVQPLIRYELTDKIFFKAEKQAGKYPLTAIDNILGRDEDIMWFKDKDGKFEFIHPLSVEGICVDGLLDYQFIQEDDYSFEILLQCGSDSGKREQIKSEVSLQMEKILSEKQLCDIRFDVKFTDAIEVNTATGKKPLIKKTGVKAH